MIEIHAMRPADSWTICLDWELVCAEQIRIQLANVRGGHMKGAWISFAHLRWCSPGTMALCVVIIVESVFCVLLEKKDYAQWKIPSSLGLIPQAKQAEPQHHPKTRLATTPPSILAWRAGNELWLGHTGGFWQPHLVFFLVDARMALAL